MQRPTSILLASLLITAAAAYVGCGSDSKSSSSTGGSGGTGGTSDSTGTEGGSGPCKDKGGSCTDGLECCSNVCGADKTCQAPTACIAVNATCNPADMLHACCNGGLCGDNLVCHAQE